MTTDRVQPALDDLLGAQAENARQERLLFNPDTEVNSLVEHVLDLRRYGVPKDRLRQILADLREVLISNGREREGERTAAGVLDDLLRSMHAGGMRSQIRVHELSRALRPLLAREGAGVQPHAALAHRDILRLAETYGTEKLLCAGLRWQLTPAQYTRLTELLQGAPR